MYIIAFSAIIVLSVTWWLIRKTRKSKQPGKLSFHKRPQLFTASERAFRDKLDDAVSEQFDIFARVTLSDLLSIDENSKRTVAEDAEKIIRQHKADFVLCDKETSAIQAVIQLENDMRMSKEVLRRRQFIEQACQAARLPLIRLDGASQHTAGTLRRKIQTTLEPTIVLDEADETEIKVYIEPTTLTATDKVQTKTKNA